MIETEDYIKRLEAENHRLVNALITAQAEVSAFRRWRLSTARKALMERNASLVEQLAFQAEQLAELEREHERPARS